MDQEKKVRLRVKSRLSDRSQNSMVLTRKRHVYLKQNKHAMPAIHSQTFDAAFIGHSFCIQKQSETQLGCDPSL